MNRVLYLACLVPLGSARADIVQEVINFESDCSGEAYQAGAVIDQLCGAGGAGPIWMSGHVGGERTENRAVLFDSANPSGDPIDDDLGSPNAACPGGGPGMGPGGVPGAMLRGIATENCPATPLGLILIVAENLDDADGDGLVDDPDDADIMGSALRLNFSELGAVTLYGLTIMDIDVDEPKAELRLYADPRRRKLLTSIELPRTADNGVVVVDLEPQAGVVVMEVVLNGSGALDNILFAYGSCGADCDDGNACTNDYCDEDTGECVFEPLECDDSDPCNPQQCIEGQCLTTPIDCDDSDPCAPFICIEGACVVQTVECDAPDPCFPQECVEGLCVEFPVECESDDPCAPQSCMDGQCVSQPLDCDDGDPCTIDTCIDGACVNEAGPDCVTECRVTGGANGQQAGDGNRYHGSGQAGAPNPQFGEWTHHQIHGPDGRFVFHAGTASAPDDTLIEVLTCSDPGFCDPAREAPAKQIDFAGVGTFKNIQQSSAQLDAVVPGETRHWFTVHIEDLGEPGGRGGPQELPDDSQCPAEGSSGATANCECEDYYRLVIYAPFEPGDEPNTLDVIYEVSNYIRSGNYQIHPALD